MFAVLWIFFVIKIFQNLQKERLYFSLKACLNETTLYIFVPQINAETSKSEHAHEFSCFSSVQCILFAYSALYRSKNISDTLNMLFKTTETSSHNKNELILYRTRLGSNVLSSKTGILSSSQSCTDEDTCSGSDFTEWFDQRPHFCIAGFDSLLCIPQLWGQAGSDGHTHQDISTAVIVSHTAMNLATDETGQFLLLLDKRQKFQSDSSAVLCFSNTLPKCQCRAATPYKGHMILLGTEKGGNFEKLMW